jgi:hypothetical protein
LHTKPLGFGYGLDFLSHRTRSKLAGVLQERGIRSEHSDSPPAAFPVHFVTEDVEELLDALPATIGDVLIVSVLDIWNAYGRGDIVFLPMVNLNHFWKDPYSGVSVACDRVFSPINDLRPVSIATRFYIRP